MKYENNSIEIFNTALGGQGYYFYFWYVKPGVTGQIEQTTICDS